LPACCWPGPISPMSANKVLASMVSTSICRGENNTSSRVAV
jgi:hypothetical protein